MNIRLRICLPITFTCGFILPSKEVTKLPQATAKHTHTLKTHLQYLELKKNQLYKQSPRQLRKCKSITSYLIDLLFHLGILLQNKRKNKITLT